MPANDTISGHSLEADLALIREAASAAGKIALKYFKSDPEVWLKTGQSPVSEADLAVDRFLKEELLAARPDYGWVSEESDRKGGEVKHQAVFVVDPIDGTRAFIDGRKVWCVSVAIVRSGKSQAGVLNCPAKEEEIYATRGSGAWSAGTRLGVSKPELAPHIGGPSRMIRELAEPLKSRVREGKYVPSLAYRIAMVAAGELDATFVKPNAHDWDVAAADIILSEAGGILLDAAQKPPYYAGPEPRLGALAAGSGDLLDQMVPVLSLFDQ